MGTQEKPTLRSLEPFAYGFLACKSEEICLRIASGMRYAADFIPIYLDDEVCFPNASWGNAFGVTYTYGGGIQVDVDCLNRKAAEHPEFSDELNGIRDAMLEYSTGRLISLTRTSLDHELMANNTGWGGGWGGHSNPDYGMLLELGTSGLRARIRIHSDEHPESADWYESLHLALDAFDVVARRASLLCLLRSRRVGGELSKLYQRMSQAFKRVPKKPADDFLEGLCCFYLAYTFDGNDSPGRFDQYMFETWRDCDLDEGREYLERIWIGFHKMRSWNLCLGGTDENWADMSNTLTYVILDIARKYRFNTPNITLRCHRDMPDSLREKVWLTLCSGIGMPALYNDEVVCPALEALRIPPEDAHDYCMNGCNQIDIQGKSHMGLEDGEISVAKCLEYALFDGVCLHTGKQLAPRTGDARNFSTFEELMDAYKKQLDWAVDWVVRLANESQRIYGEYAPNPWRSNLIQGCVEKGRDYKRGGPWYNHGQILTEGLADAVDSLAAIRHFVYETGELTMGELLDALREDFRDREELRLKLRNYEGKFGNDIEEVDALAKEIIDHHYHDMLMHRTWRDSENGLYGGGLSTFNRTAKYGSTLGATASGRHAGDPNLADSIGAVPGFDRNGPTSAVKSALAYDHTLAKSGFVFQMKFAKTIFASPEGKSSFFALWDAFFKGGGQQLTVNVLDSEALREAQLHPELHRDLIVRVGGYSAYFVDLPKDLQDNIISRTMF